MDTVDTTDAIASDDPTAAPAASGPPARPRRLPLATLLVANAISFVGDVLALLAIPWFVLQTTGSLTRTGLAAFCAAAGVAASALVGSLAVDRLGYKRMSLLSDGVSAVAIASVPLLYRLGALAFWELLVLVFLVGLAATPGRTARSAYLPDLAAAAGVRLERATAAADGGMRISGFIGAPLAGVLIALTGATTLLWLDGASFACSALLIGLLVPASHPVRRAPSQAMARARRGRFLAELGEGSGYLRHDRVLRAIIVTVMVTNLLDNGFSAVLAPAYVRATYGSAIPLGGMIAGFGGGAFVGTLLFGAFGHRLPRRLSMGLGFTLAAPSRWFMLVFIHNVPLLVALNALAGVCIGPINPLISTLSYERIPPALRARVLGLVTAGAFIGTPLGGLSSALLGARVGVPVALLLFGSVYLAATLSLLLNPALRGMNATPAPPALDPA
jgi:MFS family permease